MPVTAWVGAAVAASAQPVDPVWPTPNSAWAEGRSLATFVQPTASGEVTSGLYGCVRSSGAQFHEGLDLKPVSRDRRGEATDPIFAVLSGTVRHVSRNPGESSYGRYVVIEHTDVSPSVITLYAHLSSIPGNLSRGDKVERGATIGVMGRSASGYAIPKDRAHLHLEIGLWLSRDFQRWYDWKKFGSRNEHGLWNGMNIIGIDPLEFYNSLRSGAISGFEDHFKQRKAAVRVRIATKLVPDFIERYPALLTKPYPAAQSFGGWQVLFDEFAVPFAWTPLDNAEVSDLKTNDPVAEPVEGGARTNRCKSLVFRKPGRYAVGKDLETVLQLLFGLRKEL